MLRADPYKARGLGGGGISLADKQALIQLTNEAEANNEAIKETMRQKLNAFDSSLAIPSGSVWNTLYNSFDTLQTSKTKLAQNIAAKGVAAASGDSLQTLANKVGQIKTEPFNPLKAGDTYLYQNSTLRQTTNQTAYVINRGGYIAQYPGTIRVLFDFATSGGTGFARIYKNGIAVGTERTRNSTTFITFSEDITVNTGDDIQIYCRTASGGEAYTQNVRIGITLPEMPVTQGT